MRETHARTHARTREQSNPAQGGYRKVDGRERKGLPSFDLILISASRSVPATAGDRYLAGMHPPFNPMLR